MKLILNEIDFIRLENNQHQEGFTLIEIAMILIIIGLLLGIGAGMIGPLTKQAKLIETRKTMDAAVESIISYGAANDKLPTTGNFSATVKNPKDAWQKSLYYILDTNLTDTSVGGICGRKSTDLAMNICPDTGCSSPTETISNVAFMVLSGGGNYNNQTAGTQAVSSATTINTYEVDVSVDSYTTDMNRTEAADDIIRWVTIDELRTKAGCVGSPLKVVNNELPYGYVSSVYSATVYGDGGVPYSSGGNYRWCRQESASTGLTLTPSTSNSDCLSLTESSWTQADTLVISGTPATAGSYNFTFFVRDDNDSSGTNDNIAHKTIVLTINPSSSSSACSSSCTDFRVWNNLGAKYDFYRDGQCKDRNDGDEITKAGDSVYLNSGETITRYSTNNESCGGAAAATLTFSQAQCADTDGDCQVNFDATDR